MILAPHRAERVLVAMSGGVDSSVAAALLTEGGFEPIGLTLVMHPAEDGPSNADGAVATARGVAKRLGIRHETMECADAFTGRVLRPSWEEYLRGRTPNPCLHCNRVVKFASLLERADALDARWIASGHYCRITRDAAGVTTLQRATDPDKDQSYFLARLTQHQLSRCRFPLGDLDKTRVRALARELGLESADRAESQDSCLETGRAGFAETLRRRFGGALVQGDIVDRDGRTLGRHDGLHRFTIGQRKGLGVALGRKAYVVGLDAERNRVVVSDEPRDLMTRRVIGVNMAWVVAPPAPDERRVLAQIRYRHRAAPARARWDDTGKIRVTFDEPQRAAAPGQGLVLYDRERVLGGAWIERTN